MNWAHIHLILNHIPVVGLPITLAFLVYSTVKKNDSAQKFSLLMLTLIAALVLPVFLTGEPAEEFVEDLPGIGKKIIHEHEEAGEIAMVLTLLAGASALSSLFMAGKNERLRGLLVRGAIGLATVATLDLAYAANLGGQIRHAEIRSDDPAMMQPLDREGDDGMDADDDDEVSDETPAPGDVSPGEADASTSSDSN